MAGDTDHQIKKLKEIQKEISELEAWKLRDESERHLKYQTESSPIFEKRREIIRGETSPTGSEYKVDLEVDTIEGNGIANGIPAFWLRVLKNHDMISEHIKQRDEDALRFLEDIRLNPAPADSQKRFRVEFQFSENPFFHNKILFVEILHSVRDNTLGDAGVQELSAIRWKGSDKNLTLKMIAPKSQKKQKGGKGKKAPEASASPKFRSCASFFSVFSNQTKSKSGSEGGKPEEAEEEEEDGSEEPMGLEHGLRRLSEVQLDVLEGLMEVVPNAVQFFSEEGLASAEGGDGSEMDGSDSLEVEQRAQVQRRLRALQVLHSKHAELEEGLKREGEGAGLRFEQKLEEILERRRVLVGGGALGTGGSPVPRFWLLALRGSLVTVELVRRRDEALLGHLADIRWRRVSGGTRGIHVEFEFLESARSWMRQRVLTKTYYFSDEDGKFLVGSEATRIEWEAGRDLTVKQGESRSGEIRIKPCRSFFQLFDANRVHLLFPSDGGVQLSNDELREKEWELCLAFQTVIIPQAGELYLEAREWANEEGEDDEEEDEEDEEEEEEEGEGLLDEGSIKKRLLRRQRKEKDESVVCCGLSRNSVFVLLCLLVLAGPVLSALSYFL